MVLTTLPGQPLKITCHEGVDGIAWDAKTSTLIVPDPVTGTIYRLAPDGSARDRPRAGVRPPRRRRGRADGSVYVANECGGDVWRLAAGGARPRGAGHHARRRGLDGQGNLLVTDVRHINHDVRRWPLGGGASTCLARSGLIEPQGLLVATQVASTCPTTGRASSSVSRRVVTMA